MSYPSLLPHAHFLYFSFSVLSHLRTPLPRDARCAARRGARAAAGDVAAVPERVLPDEPRGVSDRGFPDGAVSD